MTTLNFVCIVSSVREGKLANRMVKLIQKTFDEKMKSKGHTLSILDPEDYNLAVVKQPLHFYRDRSEAPEVLHKLNKIVLDADAYLVLTAEYNRTLPPALTNLLDHIPPSSFDYKSSGLISYSPGSQGGCFAVAAARPFLAELGCLPVKHCVTIASASKEVSEDGVTENTHIVSSLGKLFGQVEWWGQAAKETKKTTPVPK